MTVLCPQAQAIPSCAAEKIRFEVSLGIQSKKGGDLTQNREQSVLRHSVVKFWFQTRRKMLIRSALKSTDLWRVERRAKL